VEIYSTELARGISGVLLRDATYKTSSGFVVLVARNEPSVRQRFTAAHELGHFVLHRELVGDRIEDNFLLRSNKLSDNVEVEANKFAADLLMPYALIDQAMTGGIRTPEDLARHFHVSVTAMSIRLNLPT
jgi:Zn-dependent peptidase ImmA (M78 family)